MAAGVALLAPTHPIFQHLKDDALMDHASELSKTAKWSPLFLSATQNAQLIVLAECMVPESTTAGVNRFIDLLLSVETAENQAKFNESLSVIENEAKERFERAFSALIASEQESLLTVISQEPATRRHFENLKNWISGAYYSSEVGMRELGWDGTYAFASYPECETAAGS
jgi:hypothetical protein